MAEERAAPRSRIGFIRIAAIVIGLAAPIVLGLITLRNALDVPIGDEWAWVLLLYTVHTSGLHFADIWAQHNEHRIVFPALLMLSLARFGGYNVVREIAANVAIVIMTLSVFVILIRKTITPAAAPFVFMLVSLLLFSMAQYENWTWGFQMAWFLVNLCAVAAMVLLAARPGSLPFVAAAAMCAVIASFSVSSGLDIWIAGAFVLACTRPISIRSLAVWCLAGAACFALYLHGYVKPPAHPSTTAFAGDPLGFANYLLTYLGAPFAFARHPYGVLPAGLAVSALIVVCAVTAVRLRKADRARVNAAMPWFGLAVFAGLSAGMTAIGRFGFGVDQAFSSRYVTVSSIFWIGAIGAAVVLMRDVRLSAKRFARAGAVVIAVLFAGSYIAANRVGLILEQLDKDHRLSAYVAIENLDTADDLSLSYAFPAVTAIRHWAPLLDEIHEGPFRR